MLSFWLTEYWLLDWAFLSDADADISIRGVLGVLQNIPLLMQAIIGQQNGFRLSNTTIGRSSKLPTIDARLKRMCSRFTQIVPYWLKSSWISHVKRAKAKTCNVVVEKLFRFLLKMSENIKTPSFKRPWQCNWKGMREKRRCNEISN